MVSNTTNSVLFSSLPTTEPDEERQQRVVQDGHSILAPEIESSSDQILDGLLTRVGYGLFQKKLLVKQWKKRKLVIY